MNEQIKQRWIAALRSGEYNQGTGFLRLADNSYCCLGVLCDLYAKEHAEVTWEIELDHYTIFTNKGAFPDSSLLPPTVATWAGIKNEYEYPMDDVYISIDGEETCLSRLNDDGISFAEIANIIEREV